MRICAAQIRPFKGDVDRNIVKHKKFADLAVSHGVDLIVFPELSLTGYEPKLCSALATRLDDHRLNDLQTVSNSHKITICVGLPTANDAGIMITMIILQPGQPRQAYSKQRLHEDELPYFVPGGHQVILTINGSKVAPAICYESLLPEHSSNAFELGSKIYIASVAKSANGVAKAFRHYPVVAKEYGMTVLMANCVGPCDDFESMGSSSIWNANGTLLGKLNETGEGILIHDLDTNQTIEYVVERSS